MDIKKLILKKLNKNKKIKVAEIVKATGFSRAYINRFFQELKDEGKVVLIGKSNKAQYVLAEKNIVMRTKEGLLVAHRVLENKNLAEDIVLDEIKRNTGIFLNLPKNVSAIIDYAFTEMLNNAIEHSQSKKIEISMKRDSNAIRFDVVDWGIGIFKHIMKKGGLGSELEAIHNLSKGKETTAPKKHSGEGIFFTSKVADILTIKSSEKKLIFHNVLDDIFIKDIKKTKGTKVTFIINPDSKRKLYEVFRKYSGKSYEFSKTKVNVKLYNEQDAQYIERSTARYRIDTGYLSRSQARRIVSGLDKFKTVILDFKDVETVGQAFIDEVFRVWQNNHPNIEIIPENANQNIVFMIKRINRLEYKKKNTA